MKNLILKKIIPIFTCIIILLSIFSFSVFAETVDNPSASQLLSEWDKNYIPGNLHFYNLTPGSAFAWFNCADGYLGKETDSQANAVFDNNDQIYYFDFSRSSPSTSNSITNIFFNINVGGQGYTLQPNVNYYFRMKIIIPTSYGINGSSSFSWSPSNFTGGGYSWASVSYNDRKSYNFQLYSPQMQALVNREVDIDTYNFPIYPYKVPGSSVELCYFDVTGTVTRNSSMLLKSFGFELPIYNSWGWHGWIGIGGFQIGVDPFHAPLDTPDIDKKPSQDLDDLEQELLDEISFQNDLDNIYGVFDTFDTDSLDAVNYIFTNAFQSHPLINRIFQLSLALGITGFVLSTAHIIVNKSSNKPTKIKRGKGGE